MNAYISGPMMGLPDFNFPAFFDLAEHICCLEWEPINPAAQVDFGSREDAHRHNVKLLIDANIVVMLPRWELDRFAIAEKSIAELMNIPVAYAYEFSGEYSIYFSPICVDVVNAVQEVAA